MKARTYLFLFIFAISIWYVFLKQDLSETWAGQSTTNSAPDKEIPKQAIRLRILANSDQVGDQWLKRKVRDEVIREIKTWVQQPKTIDEARKAVNNHLPHFQQIAEETIAKYGYSYPVKVDFGKVPFPTKLYGNRIYPAGNYEALRITIGKGEGDNWWCVLFPPLCFVDMSNGDAIPQKNNKTFSASIAPQNQVYAATHTLLEKEHPKKPVEVRFLFLDQLSNFFGTK